ETDEKKKLIGQAQEFFQKSIDEKSNFASGYYQLSVTQAALDNLDPAIETMNKAVNLDKGNIDYFFSLARLYQQRGRDEDNKIAEAIFKKILSVNDKEINTHFSLAMLYEKMNEPDKAIAEYNSVIAQLPADNAEVISKVRLMIENVRSGAGNQTQTAPAAQEGQPAGQ
ncbi:MAG: tetratricopeptide repeat protein, partial [Candidatus Moranbacteria bacterium]|nr:tetratricopeptide repeat protein [Candidatus Moranbacteria bacterium]